MGFPTPGNPTLCGETWNHWEIESQTGTPFTSMCSCDSHPGCVQLLLAQARKEETGGSESASGRRETWEGQRGWGTGATDTKPWGWPFLGLSGEVPRCQVVFELFLKNSRSWAGGPHAKLLGSREQGEGRHTHRFPLWKACGTVSITATHSGEFQAKGKKRVPQEKDKHSLEDYCYRHFWKSFNKQDWLRRTKFPPETVLCTFCVWCNLDVESWHQETRGKPDASPRQPGWAQIGNWKVVETLSGC